MSTRYPIPAQTLETTLEVKKSRFIARVHNVSNREQAMACLAQARLDYPDARHHCWAYLIGDPVAASNAAMNDDGEPSGTAGKPILNVIQHKGIGDVMVIVIRYFGGIKLGAGGLVRAYSGVTEQALAALPLSEVRTLARFRLRSDFAQEQTLRHWLDQHQGNIVDVAYDTAVTLTVELEQHDEETLADFCAARGIEVTENETG